ncbi:hypothetical protein [Rhizobium mongolense]|uniref:hypothetical protein n=1 Tax=Rhizobium mongolense TaxID=57676 RepID=UPI0034A50618
MLVLERLASFNVRQPVGGQPSIAARDMEKEVAIDRLIAQDGRHYFVRQSFFGRQGHP